MAKKAKKANKKLQMHTLAQYVALSNNEDRLIGERSIALVFAASFLAVVWAADGPFGLEVRLAVAILGLLVTLMLWRVIFRGAQAAQDWRDFAIKEEKQLYFGRYVWKPALSLGPYGLRTERDENRNRGPIDQLLYGRRRPYGCRKRPVLGRTNVWSALLIPLILVFWWIFAIAYTVHHDFEVTHTHEVTDSVESEVDQTTPDHPN